MRLELDRVTAAYGDNVALRDVSIIVPEGRVVALLGPNGAGKTTLLRVASGLTPARSGRVCMDRADINAASFDQRVRMGMCHVTEGRSIFPSLSVRDNLRLFAPRNGASDATERALSAFPKLGDRLGQTAGTMSGGEQQMLALARAYTSRAPLVLLDEVSMGLAPLIIDEIFSFLAALAAQGTSLLIVEQYVSKALALADHAYVLTKGRISFAGEAAELAATDIFSHYIT